MDRLLSRLVLAMVTCAARQLHEALFVPSGSPGGCYELQRPTSRTFAWIPSDDGSVYAWRNGEGPGMFFQFRLPDIIEQLEDATARA